MFKIQRVTKQVDPCFFFLFNTVLQGALEDDLKSWREKGMGISLGDHYSDCQSNLVFPDVVVLFPTSLDQLKIMMGDFRRSTEKVGLKIHPVKTKILTNQRSNRQSEATIDDIEVDVLPISEKAKYLGQTITFEQKETTEIQSRIRAAWASFSRYRQELSSRSCLLRHRLRLFIMVITPTLTCGSGTWTLSQEHEKLFRSTERKMLRLIVQTVQRPQRIDGRQRIGRR